MNKSEEKMRKDIRSIRRSMKITQKDMGNKLNITESSYNRIESGEIALSYAHLLAISDIFGMSISDMLTYPNNGGEINIGNTTNIGHHNKIGNLNNNIGYASQAISPTDYANLQQQVEELKADKERLYQLLLKQ